MHVLQVSKEILFPMEPVSQFQQVLHHLVACVVWHGEVMCDWSAEQSAFQSHSDSGLWLTYHSVVSNPVARPVWQLQPMEHFCSVLLSAVTKGTIHVLCPMNMDVTILRTIYWYKVSCLQVVYSNEIARNGSSTVQIYINSRCQDIFPMICGVSIYENLH